MSENSTPEQRTELPTARRMEQLRGEGQLFVSTEIAQLATLLAGFLALSALASGLWGDLQQVLRHCFAGIVTARGLDANQAWHELTIAMITVGPRVGLMVLIVATVAILAVMLQTDWNMRNKWIKWRWNLLDPIGGIKRIVSVQGFVNVGKAILKLCVILPFAFFALRNLAPQMLSLVHMSLDQTLILVSNGIDYLFWKIFVILLPFALFDFFWGKFQWLKVNKMTKVEIKDERKSTEGDEETRRKIIQKGLTRIMQRIKNSVPKADVVVTNPTHISVALQYDRATMSAPKVVAKGKGFLALRIREIAREAGVPVIERKPLARALYASTEVGSEIPHELFKAVAEVLAFVYRLKNPWARGAGART